MDKTNSVDGAANHDAGVLKTKFITPDQTAALVQILDLALEDLDQVGGGLVRADNTCTCPPPTCTSKNCASHCTSHLRVSHV